jgi:hypothetical protein
MCASEGVQMCLMCLRGKELRGGKNGPEEKIEQRHESSGAVQTQPLIGFPIMAHLHAHAWAFTP